MICQLCKTSGSHLLLSRYLTLGLTLHGREQMLRNLAVIVLLAALTACAENAGSAWNRQTWGDPSFKPNYASMKTLEQPGIY